MQVTTNSKWRPQAPRVSVLSWNHTCTLYLERWSSQNEFYLEAPAHPRLSSWNNTYIWRHWRWSRHDEPYVTASTGRRLCVVLTRHACLRSSEVITSQWTLGEGLNWPASLCRPEMTCTITSSEVIITGRHVTSSHVIASQWTPSGVHFFIVRMQTS